MIDAREAILDRLRKCLASIRPGVKFASLGAHRPIVSDLGGRVFPRVRSEAKADETECPYVELITSANTADSVREIGDDGMYLAEIRVDLWGYVKGRDAGDDYTAPVRRELNALRADLIVAMEAFPFWTDTDNPEPIRKLVGEVVPVLITQWTEPATETSDGFLLIEYGIRYAFDRTNP